MKPPLSGSLASLGAGTPYAMAGKMAFPERTAIACMGDGAMQTNGLNVMIPRSLALPGTRRCRRIGR